MRSDFQEMAKKSFESALARLEQITEELEAGDLTLAKSLAKSIVSNLYKKKKPVTADYRSQTIGVRLIRFPSSSSIL